MYYDTPDLALAAARVTLRRRTGGADAGWHVKLPVAGDERHELRVPLAGDDLGVPALLLDEVKIHLLGKPPHPVARISTRRVVQNLLDADGRVLAEFCDDHVSADRMTDDSGSLAWRE